jgi:xanthine dehydrogenase accessory factor
MSLTSALTTRQLREQASRWLDDRVAAIVVKVDLVKGSTPRGVGTRMLVSENQIIGTIGGGHLEWQATDLARQALQARQPDQPSASPWQRTFPLGPTLGQCCGGSVTLGFAWLTADTLADWVPTPPRMHVELHGAGHVGQAIVRLLMDLECTVRWIDTRDAQEQGCGLPDAQWLNHLPSHIVWLPSDAPEMEVAAAPPGSHYLVLTHRHDLDQRIIEAVLRRGDIAFAGMIGSQTKRAKFMRRLAERGLSPAQLARLVCPIGISGLSGKEPNVIAISVVAQLLHLTSQTERVCVEDRL